MALHSGSWVNLVWKTLHKYSEFSGKIMILKIMKHVEQL